MGKPVTGLNTFASQLGPIPLSQLDTDFSSLQSATNDFATYSNYLVDSSGAANTITCSIPSFTTFALTAGIQAQVKIANTTTLTTVNANINGTGNVRLKNQDGTDPQAGSLKAGGIYTLQYDGTNYQIQGATGSLGVALCKAKAAATTRPSTIVPTNDPDLQFFIPGAGTYRYEFWLIPSNVGAPGAGFALNVNYSGTFVSFSNYLYDGSVGGGAIAQQVTDVANATTTVQKSGTLNGAVGLDGIRITGVIVATGPGTLALAWSQNGSNASGTSMNIGSFATLTQLS